MNSALMIQEVNRIIEPKGDWIYRDLVIDKYFLQRISHLEERKIHLCLPYLLNSLEDQNKITKWELMTDHERNKYIFRIWNKDYEEINE